jgi:hypothetical protein
MKFPVQVFTYLVTFMYLPLEEVNNSDVWTNLKNALCRKCRDDNNIKYILAEFLFLYMQNVENWVETFLQEQRTYVCCCDDTNIKYMLAE